MKNKKMMKTICLAAAGLILTSGLIVESAMAYFTTYAVAEGGMTLDLGFTETVPEETVVDGRKEILIENTGDYDCYVRIKALTGDAYKDSIVYSEPDGAGKWTPGPDADGYYYFNDIVKAGSKTTQINVGFSFPEKEPTDFNVIIIQESTPVLYDESGAPYADWNEVADVSQSVYQ